MNAQQLKEQYGTVANLPHHAFPGGYAIEWIMADSEVICSECLHDKDNPVTFDADSDDPAWRIAGLMLIEAPEDDYVSYCAHCNKDIAAS